MCPEPGHWALGTPLCPLSLCRLLSPRAEAHPAGRLITAASGCEESLMLRVNWLSPPTVPYLRGETGVRKEKCWQSSKSLFFFFFSKGLIARLAERNELGKS